MRGTPPDAIARLAAKIRTDLIVMGTQGRANLTKRLLGSTAERVLRLASCPVLGVHDIAGSPAPVPWAGR